MKKAPPKRCLPKPPGEPPGNARSLRGRCHTVVTQQRVDLRLAAAERLERFHRRTAAAHFEDLAAIARAGRASSTLLSAAASSNAAYASADSTSAHL
jgi:hypothetical protein